jgi:ABC-2 type transport system permease protein
VNGLSWRRTGAIFRKELREYRRNNSIVSAMAIIPLIFLVQPVVIMFKLPASAALQLSRENVLLYLLAVPALVPALVASYSVVGERQQGTLEPVLTTPIRRDEFLLGKALAALAPSITIAYAVFGIFVAVVRLFAQQGIASALLRWPLIGAQIGFTPLVAGWSILVGIAISARVSDTRVAQQLGTLASLPAALLAALFAFGVIHATLQLALGFAAGLLVIDGLGWRALSVTLNRERLITGSR